MTKANTEKDRLQVLIPEDSTASSKAKRQFKKFKKNKNDAEPISHAGRERSDEERYQ